MAEEKIAKTITFDYKDKTYVLEFDRASVLRAERMYDFKLNELLGSVKMGTMHDMFSAAMYKHQPKASQSLINEIYNRMGDKVDLYQRLVQMYLVVTNSVLGDEDVDEGNLVSWREA